MSAVRRLKELFLYAGVDKAEYDKLLPDIRKENAKGYLGYASRFDFAESMDKMERFYLKVIADKKNEA